MNDDDEITQTVTPRRLREAPKAFTRNAIREFLEARGACGIIDTFALSTLLGTISQRSIRNHTNAGRLKPMNPGRPPFIYTIEAVIDWLMENPRYIAQQREMWEVTEETSTLIRKIIHKSWKTMLQFIDEEELVAETQYRMMKTPKTECSEGRVIVAILGKIYRDTKRQLKTVSLDNINQDRERI